MAMTLEELDTMLVLSKAQDIGEMILASEEMHIYIAAKKAMNEDPGAQQKLHDLQKLKDQYDEVQRFGKYHPDYSRVNGQVRQAQREVQMTPSIRAFKKAETALDDLLYHVCRVIADGVSESIKVPSDNPLYSLGSGCGTGGCGTGGSCGCGGA